MSFSLQQIDELKAALPARLKPLLGSEETGAAIYNLWVRHGIIDPKKQGAMLESILFFTLGLLTPPEFVQKLSLVVPAEGMRTLVQDMLATLFQPYREAFRQAGRSIDLLVDFVDLSALPRAEIKPIAPPPSAPQIIPISKSPEIKPPPRITEKETIMSSPPRPPTGAPATIKLEVSKPRLSSTPIPPTPPASRITFPATFSMKPSSNPPSEPTTLRPVFPPPRNGKEIPVKEIRFAVPSETEEVPLIISPNLAKPEPKSNESIAMPTRIVTPSTQLPKIESPSPVQGTGIRPLIETPATPPPTAPLRPITLPIPKPQPSAPPSMPSSAAPRPPEVSPMKLAPKVIQTPPSQQGYSPTIQTQQGVSALTPSPAIPKVITPPPKPQSSVEVIDLSTFEIKKGPTPSTQ